jgi:outer membrane protein insertion porin family
MFGLDKNLITTYSGSTPQSIIDYIDAMDLGAPSTPGAPKLGWARDPQRLLHADLGHLPARRAGAHPARPTAEYYASTTSSPSTGRSPRGWCCAPAPASATATATAKTLTRNIYDASGNFVKTVTASGLPFFENFYAGGTASARGFQDNTLGPRSEATSYHWRGQPLGGSVQTIGHLEFVFPKLFDSKAARVSAFVDAGNVFRRLGQRRKPTSCVLRPASRCCGARRSARSRSATRLRRSRRSAGDELERIAVHLGGQF